MYLAAEQMDAVVPAALEVGIQHFEGAQIYGNEAALGRARARKDIFVTSKIWVANLAPDRFIPSLDESLEKLQLDHVDLLLLHWPTPSVALEEQLTGLKIAAESGKILNASVSNITRDWLDRTFALSDLPLITNQVELHPHLHQPRPVAASRKYGLALIAYFAMAEDRVPKDPVLTEIASRFGKSAAQVALRWLLQQDFAVLTRSTNQSQVTENTGVFDFALSDQDMVRIAGLADPKIPPANFEGLAPVSDD